MGLARVCLKQSGASSSPAFIRMDLRSSGAVALSAEELTWRRKVGKGGGGRGGGGEGGRGGGGEGERGGVDLGEKRKMKEVKHIHINTYFTIIMDRCIPVL